MGGGPSDARFLALHGLSHAAGDKGARPEAVDVRAFLDGVIPVSEGNAEAQSPQRGAEGEGGILNFEF